MVCLLFITDRLQLQRAARVRKSAAFRPGIKRNIVSHVSLYLVFTERFGLPDLPATARSLLCFGEFLLWSFKAPRSVTIAFASLRHFHLDCAFSVAAFEEREVFLWRRALFTTVRHVPTGAPPLPAELLRRLCALARQLGLLGQVFATLASVLFYSMTRLSSLLPEGSGSFDHSRLPIWGDLREVRGECFLDIKWAKNMQMAEGRFSVPLVAAEGSPACPVDNLARLAKLVPHRDAGSPLFMLPAQAACELGGLACLNMRVAREWLRLLLRRLGEADKGYTFHSFRRGACSLAFDNGAVLNVIKALGGWSSEAVELYLPADAARRRAAGTLSQALL